MASIKYKQHLTYLCLRQIRREVRIPQVTMRSIGLQESKVFNEFHFQDTYTRITYNKNGASINFNSVYLPIIQGT